ncbi:MAG: YlxM family DNA-binding protein [Bacillota bacterium]|nr:YlxM family DNA-binding protein [Bacillota bacterium]
MIEKFVEISLLYDFYGKILTDKQRDIIDLYYMKDLSLGEISELQGISRQAVHDNLRRAEKQLRTLEESLGLVERFLAEKEKWNIVLEKIEAIVNGAGSGCNGQSRIEELKWIRNYISEMLGG